MISKWYCIVFSFFLSLLCYANDPYISLSKITPDGGVAYSQVTSIIEDNKGVIWFSTNNGLFSYNSISIKKYSHLPNNLNTISTNRINSIYKDQKGKMWVATENGVCSYDEKIDNFNRYLIRDQFDNLIGKNITSFFQDKKGTYWFSDENGVGTIDFSKNRAFYKNINSKKSTVNLLSKDENESIWVFYNDGEIYYLPEGSTTFQYFSTGLKSAVRTVLIENEKIWIGYESEGLRCISSIDGKLIHKYDTDFPSHQIRSIIKDSQNRIWIGTYKGVVIIDDFKVSLTINQQKYTDLPNNSIWSLYKDSQNNIWIGTWMGGIAFHSDYNNSFLHYSQSTSKNSINDNIVSCFTKIPNRNEILIGTDDGNLYEYSPKSNIFKIKPILYKGEQILNIKSLTYDKNETLWVGTYGKGVFYQKKNSKVFQKLTPPFSTGFQALHILATNDGIWVSDYPLGVYFYNFKSKQYTRYNHNPLNINSISNDKVHHIIEDNNKNIWFATENGLNFLKHGTSEFLHFFHQEKNPKSISTNYIYSIHKDTQGFLWLGTNGLGLNKFNPATGNSSHFTVKSGLAGNEIFSILEDSQKNLWLTTENGLCKFNPKTKEIQSYITNKGIQNNHFYPNAALVSNTNELYLGGSNGLIRFMPQKIKKNPIIANTIITKITINDKEIISNFSLNNIQKTPLKLDYLQNSINFQFITNNYINPQKNKFKYRLVGFNNDWIYTDYDGKANFTNLSPNNYIFEIKAANNNGIWNNTPTKVSIHIIPPIWKRWYAYAFYTFCTIFSIYFFRKQVINRQKLKSEIDLNIIHRKNEEQLHQMKLQFFTNISHEFRTPLTLIQGPVNRLLKTEINTTANKQLTLIKNNTDRLLRLINQFLDFRRADSGKLKLKPTNSDIISFCKNVFYCFEEHASHRNFEFNFTTDLQSLHVDFDTDKLDKVLVNVLSNAFKNSSDNGTVSLSIKNNKKSDYNPIWNIHTIGEEIKNDFIEISISDTGDGISAETLPLIFERFFILENNYNRGTGIGLSLSTNYIILHNGQLKISTLENKGTTLYIYIPKKQSEVVIDKLEKDRANNFSLETAIPLPKVIKHEENIENQESLILIAEDNPELLDFLGDSLQDHFRISKAKNGKEAYDQIHSLYPDLIVSDIMMPKMDGVQLCEKVKNDIRTSHIPIILLTALDTIQDRITGIHSGADAYLGKPFDDDLLIVQINNLLNSRKNLRESYNSNRDEWNENLNIHDLDKKLLSNAIYIINKNLSNTEFTVEDLAKKLHLSRTHLHRKLKSLTNQSATEFIREIRLQHAVKLMKEGKYMVKEIGYAVGFNSHNYFSKSFKKQFGKTPSDFAKDNFKS